MKYNPLEARCVFINGPVAVYVHEAPEQVILDAYANLKGVVEVAAAQLDTDEGSDKFCTSTAEIAAALSFGGADA